MMVNIYSYRFCIGANKLLEIHQKIENVKENVNKNYDKYVIYLC